jgi:hypothetical protein
VEIFSLFALKQGIKIPNIFEMRKINSFLYEIKTQRFQIILFHSIQQKLTLSKIVLDGHCWTVGSLKLVLIIVVIGILILLYGMDLKRHDNVHFHVNF